MKIKVFTLPLLFCLLSLPSCKGSGGGQDEHKQDFILDSSGSPLKGDLYLSVFNYVEMNTNFMQVTKGLVLKENEDFAYKSDISRSVGTDLCSLVKGDNDSVTYNIEYSKEPMVKYFDENLDTKNMQGEMEFKASLFFLPIMPDNGFYKIDIHQYLLSATYEYDYLIDDSTTEHIVTELNNVRPSGYDYFHSNIMITDVTWTAKQSGHEASKISNPKLVFKGNITTTINKIS